LRETGLGLSPFAIMNTAGPAPGLAQGRGVARVNKRKLGIMGGTFSPIHYGHLVTAEAARVEFDLDTIIFMPTGDPWQKRESGVVPAEQRYLMTVIATAANPRFVVSRMEIDRPGPTYSIDTIKALRDRHGPEVELFFITGADAVWDILNWKDPEEIARFCEFIAAGRPGYDLVKFQEHLKGKPRLPKVHVIEIPALAISSTDLRRRLKEKLPVRYLLPDSVVSYITKMGLYGAERPAAD
jgi:nicotinate-nucleotide adenylyltransferase